MIALYFVQPVCHSAETVSYAANNFQNIRPVWSVSPVEHRRNRGSRNIPTLLIQERLVLFINNISHLLHGLENIVKKKNTTQSFYFQIINWLINDFIFLLQETISTMSYTHVNNSGLRHFFTFIIVISQCLLYKHCCK